MSMCHPRQIDILAGQDRCAPAAGHGAPQPAPGGHRVTPLQWLPGLHQPASLKPSPRPAPPGIAPPLARSRGIAHFHQGLLVSPVPTPGSMRHPAQARGGGHPRHRPGAGVSSLCGGEGVTGVMGEKSGAELWGVVGPGQSQPGRQAAYFLSVPPTPGLMITPRCHFRHWNQHR